MEYILQRIKTLNEFCVICDERHIFECSLLKVRNMQVIELVLSFLSYSHVYALGRFVCSPFKHLV